MSIPVVHDSETYQLEIICRFFFKLQINFQKLSENCRFTACIASPKYFVYLFYHQEHQ